MSTANLVRHILTLGLKFCFSLMSVIIAFLIIMLLRVCVIRILVLVV